MPEETVRDIQTLLKKAKDNKWCVEFVCTTCGSGDFRKEVDSILDYNSDVFLQSVYEFDFKNIENQHEFTKAIYRIFQELKWPGQRNSILEHWIERDDLPLRSADYFLYYIVRYTHNVDLKQRWITKCLNFAKTERDVSLTETLLDTLKQDSIKNSELISLATEVADTADKIRKLVQKFSLK